MAVGIPSFDRVISFLVERCRYVCLIALLWAGLTLVASAQAQQISTLTLNPNIISSGGSVTGTVVLTSAAPMGGAIVLLSSNDYAAQVPNSVTVPAGQTSATFTVTTSYPGTHTSATITATYGSSNKNATLTIVPPFSDLRLTDVSLAPSLRFDWNGAAITSPDYYLWTLSDASHNTLATAQTTNLYTVITSVPVVAGVTYNFSVYSSRDATSLNITFTPQQVLVQDNQAIDARYDPRYSTYVYVDHNFGPTFYRGGLFVGNSTDPARMGRSFLRFPATTLISGTQVWCASVNAYFNGALVTNTTGWTVGCQTVTDNGWTVGNLTWDTAPVITPANAQATCTVTYNTSSPAPIWCHFGLSSVLDALAAQQGCCVALAVTTESSDQSGGIESWLYFAKKEYDSTKAPFILYATGAPTVELYVTVNPTTIHSTGTATGTVYLDGPVNTNTNVPLSSTTGASVPSSVTIPAGSESANFTITAGVVTQSTTVTIVAGSDDAGNRVSTTLTVLP
jgi:hypothetical protein